MASVLVERAQAGSTAATGPTIDEPSSGVFRPHPRLRSVNSNFVADLAAAYPVDTGYIDGDDQDAYLGLVRDLLGAARRLGAWLIRAGAPEATIEQSVHERRIGRPSLWPKELPPVRPLRHGDQPAGATARLTVIASPGHTDGHIAMTHPASGCVFTGDAVLIPRRGQRTCRFRRIRGVARPPGVPSAKSRPAQRCRGSGRALRA